MGFSYGFEIVEQNHQPTVFASHFLPRPGQVLFRFFHIMSPQIAIVKHGFDMVDGGRHQLVEVDGNFKFQFLQ